jgi:hypothetical protein
LAILASAAAAAVMLGQQQLDDEHEFHKVERFFLAEWLMPGCLYEYFKQF